MWRVAAGQGQNWKEKEVIYDTSSDVPCGSSGKLQKRCLQLSPSATAPSALRQEFRQRLLQRATLHLVVMEPPWKHKSNGVPVKEQVESEDGNEKDLPGKRRRTEVSGSIAQLQQLIEVFDKNKVQDDLPLEDSTGKDPMDVVQNSGEANGRSNKTALSRLQNLCKAIGWKEPSYDFEEQGPEHMKIFKCKLTVHLDGVLNTFMECFSDPRPTKKAAIEHAAQGLLWILKRSGYIN